MFIKATTITTALATLLAFSAPVMAGEADFPGGTGTSANTPMCRALKTTSSSRLTSQARSGITASGRCRAIPAGIRDRGPSRTVSSKMMGAARVKRSLAASGNRPPRQAED